jgi:hypothetical protein
MSEIDWKARALQAEQENEALRRSLTAEAVKNARLILVEQERDELQRQNTNLRHAESNAVQQYGTLRKERDEARAMISQSNSVVEMMILERERDALREGMKWYADEANWKARSRCGNCGHHLDADLPEDSAEFDAGGTARSIIDKLAQPKLVLQVSKKDCANWNAPEEFACRCKGTCELEGSKPDKGLYREGNGESPVDKGVTP